MDAVARGGRGPAPRPTVCWLARRARDRARGQPALRGGEVQRCRRALQPGPGRRSGLAAPALQPGGRAVQGGQVRRRTRLVRSDSGRKRRYDPDRAPRLQRRQHEVPPGRGRRGEGAAEGARALGRSARGLPARAGGRPRRRGREVQPRAGREEDRGAQEEARGAAEAAATATGQAARAEGREAATAGAAAGRAAAGATAGRPAAGAAGREAAGQRERRTGSSGRRRPAAAGPGAGTAGRAAGTRAAAGTGRGRARGRGNVRRRDGGGRSAAGRDDRAGSRGAPRRPAHPGGPARRDRPAPAEGARRRAIGGLVRPSASMLVAALVVLCAMDARAAVTARAQLDPPQVAVGATSDLSVDIRGTQSAAPPAIPAVDGLSVQYVGPSTQLSIVNGQTSSSITHHYTLTPRREGSFTIGPITVTVDGQTIQAGTVTLQVTASGQTGSAAGDQLHLDLTAPRTTVYLHQRVPITLTLRVGSVQVGDVQYPQVPGDGFALEPLAKPEQRQEIREGAVLQVVEFQSALTPLRTGSVTVGPATMSMSVMTTRSAQRHGFFFGGPTRQPIELTSQPLALDVLPLPEQGKPADFSGAVGRFSLDVRGAPLDVTAGDPVTMTYTLRGDGDLSSVAPPAIAGSDTLRVYPVQAATTPPGR